MADTKISALSAGTAAPGDEIPVNRGGSNFKITAGDILKINGGTITADSPVLNLTQTWNNAAVTFTGLKFNVPTDSSASGSLLMDLQVGGSSKFNVDKTGVIILSDVSKVITFGATLTTIQRASGQNVGFGLNGSNTSTIGFNGVGVSSANGYSFSSTSDGMSNRDLFLFRDAAGTLAQRNAANAQTFRVYNTYTDASNYERAKIAWDTNVLKIGTEKAGTGTARALELQTDGTTRLTIAADGSSVNNNSSVFVAGSECRINSGGLFVIYTRARIMSGSVGNIKLDDTSTGFDKLQFGGTSSSYPALKRSSATLICRLADDSANAAFESASLKTDAPTGGTAATWKLGTVASVTPTSPDRTIEVDIGGTIYYLHAKTTND